MISVDLGSQPVPRLPVLGWNGVSLRRHAPPLPVVTDGRQVVFASSGRAAIFLAMELLGVGPGDRILVPTYHCPTMVAPVTRLGATPVFYPITRSAASDLKWLAAVDTSGVKALLAAHFFGLPQAMDGVREFCNSRGIALIEDCAHAFFGSSGPTPVGAFGDLAIASLPKFFPVTEGGCLIGPSNLLRQVKISAPSWTAELQALVDAIEIGTSYGRLGVPGRVFDALASLKRRVRGAGRKALRDDDEPGDVDQQAWLDEKLLRKSSAAATRWIVRHCEPQRLIERRRANYALWVKEMEGVEGAQPLFPVLPDSAVPYVFPLQVNDPEAKYHAIRTSGIPVFRWDIAWPDMPTLEGDEGRAWQTEVFQLGCHQDLSESDISRLATGVRRLLESPAASRAR